MKTNLATTLLAASAAAFCADAQAKTGKLLLTGDVSSINGAAGCGLTPWAVIGSNATDGEIGGSAFITARPSVSMTSLGCRWLAKTLTRAARVPRWVYWDCG